MRRVHEIAELAGVGPGTMQHSLDEWKAAQRTFSREYDGAEYFPSMHWMNGETTFPIRP
jgi:hypothetical protein